MDEFELKARFTEEDFNILPAKDLAEIYPLNQDGESKVYRQLHRLGLRKGYRLNEDYFSSIIDVNMKAVSEKEIKEWLHDLKIKPKEDVILVWDSMGAVITKWNLFIKYYDDFFYPVSDDLTIFDESFKWCLYLFHEEIMFFGRNDDIILNGPKKLF